jgi:hypothetical protein
LSLVFTQVAGLAFFLYILFGMIARPLASFLYKVDTMETFFNAKTEIPDVLDDDGRVNPSPSAESLHGKPVRLSSGSTCRLCCITQGCSCFQFCCKSNPGTKRLIRLYDRAE